MSQPNKCWTDQHYQRVWYTWWIALTPYLGLRENCAPRFKSCLQCCQSTLNIFVYQKDQTNWSVLESYQQKDKSHPFEIRHVTGIAQQASNNLDCGLFVAAYTEFLSDGLQVPSYGISSETFRMRYASLL
ncbi:hypothetical protein H5410_052211 [Solanum commersonii]|uniref:Ubiquitin-like protease family profile domain-containing protein n=1 Tax=Solanum commersonii TaxID=4109 RepID=A0A9J5X3D6_SOLCO|nr:hypothetical protein H5410_052211 [Solanum commersonii]